VTTTRYTAGRIIVVTLGLVAAGVGCGAVAGVVALAVVAVIEDPRPFSDPILFAIAATLGAMVGAVCVPICWWLLLRHVPPGRAFSGLTLGGIVGGVVGFFVASSSTRDEILLVAAAGFFTAAVVLRMAHPADSQR
jgi:hypothetical protein